MQDQAVFQSGNTHILRCYLLRLCWHLREIRFTFKNNVNISQGQYLAFQTQTCLFKKSNSALLKLVLCALDNNSIWIMSRRPQGQCSNWYTQWKYTSMQTKSDCTVQKRKQWIGRVTCGSEDWNAGWERQTKSCWWHESSSDYSIPPRSRWVLWQNVLDINMLLRCNKTSLRAATLDANFIRGPMQERHLSMQMRELSISKLRRMPAKCAIVDVGFCAVTTIQMWKAFSSRILQWHRRRTLAFEVVWVSWNSHCAMVQTYRS